MEWLRQPRERWLRRCRLPFSGSLRLVGGLTKLIEPFILVFLGGTVGGMMIAMYLPIFKMGDSIK